MALNIPFSAANKADTRFGDRWDYINQMVIGTTSPNGTVLGTIAPHVSGMTYSLTGTDAARFSVSSVGEITLTNNSGLVAGNLSFNVVNNVYGTIPVTVPVVNGSGSYRFYADAANGGNDSNSGTMPHLPKLTLPLTDAGVGTIYLRRGSVFSKTGTITMADNRTFQGYGNPSLPKPVIYETVQANVNVFANSVNNFAIYDVELKGGSRGLSTTTVSTLAILRCMARDCGVGDNNSQGFYVKGVSNPLIKHNETFHCDGDGLYVVGTSGNTRGEISYNTWGTPFGTAGDCMQITGEGNASKTNIGLWVCYNTGDYSESTNASKGAFVLQGSNQCLFEHNVGWGYAFGMSMGGTRSTIRHNYLGYSYRTPRNGQEYNFIGSETHIDKLKLMDNISMFTQRGFNLSGFPSGGITEWDRADIDAQWNQIMFSQEAIKSTERLTSNIKNNIFSANYGNSFTFAGRGNTAATITKTITAFTNNGGGIGTFTTSIKCFMSIGDSVVITGMSDPTLNGTWPVVGVWTDTTFRVSGIGAQSNLTGETGTATKVLDFATINDIAGENTFQACVGTVIKTRPTISGTCQDGQTVTVSIYLPVGHTATYQWRLNHTNISGATGTSYAIPALTSATADNPFVPQHSNLNKPQLSCVITVTNPAGYKSLVTAIWPDNEVYRRVVAYF